MDQQFSSGDVYTMRKFLNSYVNQQRFFGRKKQISTDQTLEQITDTNEPSLQEHFKLNYTSSVQLGFPQLQCKRPPPLLKHQGKQMMRAINQHKTTFSLPHMKQVLLPLANKQETIIRGMLASKKDCVLQQKKQLLCPLIGYSKLQKRQKNISVYQETSL